ncbi:cysteine proteinase inhibitor 10 [Brachypodium distachyon]|uniref:Cystatin domain-containing protein n=1 Tax=Brachypodium distachyon TaxID=15368 RepID=I1IWU4_BRADI|nr:cysteine proteinase inhibitor 10 [Brachypodium distachyon]KQJ82147.1 hypothetical protein BRADI_5g06660v3 [Brachypodium distachyon]|eukprot:XP_003579572.1 cysteine proteinase inhibitor 10 [Brachypodium distachyon]
MASSTAAISLLLLLLLLAAATADPARGVVGGRTDIKNVGRNTFVQSLGRFAVAEHNRLVRGVGPATAQLKFVAVEAAQKQIVSGVKYYLKVIARARAAGNAPFDAVVVVKSGLKKKKTKELLSFTPSPK